MTAAAQGVRRKPRKQTQLLDTVNLTQYVEYDQLETEIQQLESLVDMMKMDVNELARERSRNVYDHTWVGFGWNLVRHAFTLYCIYKLFMVSLFAVALVTANSVLDLLQCAVSARRIRRSYH